MGFLFNNLFCLKFLIYYSLFYIFASCNRQYETLATTMYHHSEYFCICYLNNNTKISDNAINVNVNDVQETLFQTINLFYSFILNVKECLLFLHWNLRTVLVLRNFYNVPSTMSFQNCKFHYKSFPEYPLLILMGKICKHLK